MQKMTLVACVMAMMMIAVDVVEADERRAPPPKFTPNQVRGVFFPKLDDAFRGQRPTLSSVRKAAQQPPGNGAPAKAGGNESETSVWTNLIAPVSIEDEVKRVRLHFDSVVTTPGDFNSGGFQDARVDLTVLATLFAVIGEHGGDVRWKSDAAAARDLIARTAFNCKAGSTQVYNEAKLRKGDLQDLVSGSGLSDREADAANEWSMIADRSPLMKYAELLIDALEDATRDAESVDREIDTIKRNGELIAMLGVVLSREGMDDSDDEDYTQLSLDMTKTAETLGKAIERNDTEAIRRGASMIRQRCDACHEQYR